MNEILHQETEESGEDEEEEIKLPPLLENYLNTNKLPLTGEWWENKFGDYNSTTHDKVH